MNGEATLGGIEQQARARRTRSETRRPRAVTFQFLKLSSTKIPAWLAPRLTFAVGFSTRTTYVAGATSRN